MIVIVNNVRYVGADVMVAFRELWWGSKGSAIYSDERADFIANAMRDIATRACPPGSEAEENAHPVESFMRRVGVEGLNTPAHLLALGAMLGCYTLSDESARDTQALTEARDQLRTAWWSSGLDPAAVR